VGDFKNAGREWELKDQPEEIRVHDFEIREPDQGKVAPYGVYDLGQNVGWVSVGVDHDTAAFAVESIRRWWRWMGTRSYPRARHLLITADSGGSNGARVRSSTSCVVRPTRTAAVGDDERRTFLTSPDYTTEGAIAGWKGCYRVRNSLFWDGTQTSQDADISGGGNELRSICIGPSRS